MNTIVLGAFLFIVFLIVLILAFGITTWIKARKENQYGTPYHETKKEDEQNEIN